MFAALLAGAKARLLPILGGALALSVAACLLMHWRLGVASDQRDAAKAALKAMKANEKVITRYVDKIVEVPGPTVIRDRLVGRVCHTVDVPSPGDPAQTAAPDTVAGRSGGAGESQRAAESLRNAALNQIQCQALLEVVTPQATKKH